MRSNRLRFLATTVVLAIVAATSAQVFSRSGNPHENPGTCEECHLRDPSKLTSQEATTQLFVNDIETICLGCHSGIRLSMTHPTAVKPSFPIPADMYLDWKGELTCTTCHYMHESDTSPYSNPSYLRRNSSGRQFCYECHKPDFMNERSLSHALASARAHSGSNFTPFENADSTVDQSSLQCMTCHDGSVSGDAGATTINMGIWRHQSRRHAHPIGVDYVEAWSRKKREFVPVAMLPPDVVLPNGKVECVSCHNLYSHNDHLLSVRNYASRLCLTCHVK